MVTPVCRVLPFYIVRLLASLQVPLLLSSHNNLITNDFAVHILGRHAKEFSSNVSVLILRLSLRIRFLTSQPRSCTIWHSGIISAMKFRVNHSTQYLLVFRLNVKGVPHYFDLKTTQFTGAYCVWCLGIASHTRRPKHSLNCELC